MGKYISMEMLIEKTKETYYEALQASSTGWHEAKTAMSLLLSIIRYYAESIQ